LEKDAWELGYLVNDLPSAVAVIENSFSHTSASAEDGASNAADDRI
jgi:hypothetical protein